MREREIKIEIVREKGAVRTGYTGGGHNLKKVNTLGAPPPFSACPPRPTLELFLTLEPFCCRSTFGAPFPLDTFLPLPFELFSLELFSALELFSPSERSMPKAVQSCAEACVRGGVEC